MPAGTQTADGDGFRFAHKDDVRHLSDTYAQ
jgi:hypothetical protein